MSLLQEIDLSHNNFTGFIPRTWTSLPRLQAVDISYNNLTGPISMFRHNVNFTWIGNVLLQHNGRNSRSSVSMTLSQHLLQPEQNGYSRLDWKQRLDIAFGIARGTEYLHSGAQDMLIHRDLKPSNILLDNAMRAKVSDFGLAKIASQGHNSVVHTRVAGTIGYVAPECIETITVTRKVDVYSFGVILMELITGRKAFDETKPEDEQAIVMWFNRVFINLESPDSIQAYIDPTLEVNPETFESIVTIVRLALNCTDWEPRQRPEMANVVSALRELIQPPTVSVIEDETLVHPEVSPSWLMIGKLAKGHQAEIVINIWRQWKWTQLM